MSDDAADDQRVLAGDVDAYAALVDRTTIVVRGLRFECWANRDDAEDALQGDVSARV
jgi:hypothetical protein